MAADPITTITFSLMKALFYVFMYALLIAPPFVALWKLFTKAGRPGWSALIPFYNIWVWSEIVFKPLWKKIGSVVSITFLMIWFSTGFVLSQFFESNDIVGIIYGAFLIVAFVAAIASSFMLLFSTGKAFNAQREIIIVCLILSWFFPIIPTLCLLVLAFSNKNHYIGPEGIGEPPIMQQIPQQPFQQQYPPR